MKETIISICIASVLIGAAYVLTRESVSVEEVSTLPNVRMENGVQIVEITAKGGYVPKKSVVKEGVQTVLRINTKGTFDCSSSVRIPSMNISQNLPPSGVTDIELGNLSVGTVYGTCSMGMYPFEIEVKG